jgi:RNA 3'-terminal phosphate cyclase (ATP)
MFEIDGSFGEGGGQVLRTSVALAAVLEKEIRVFNIRAGRAEPGIRPQHMTGVKAAAQLSSAEMKGFEVGSTELVFKPGKLRSGHFAFDVGTAGSITLVLQTIMPILAFAPGKVTVEVTGGTDVKWSPPIDYVDFVVIPLLRTIGYSAVVECLKRGHYPKGGGIVRLTALGVHGLGPMISKSRGSILPVGGVSHSVGLPKHVAARQAIGAIKRITDAKLSRTDFLLDANENASFLSPGSGILVYAKTATDNILGADSLGERGKPAERVGETAGELLVEEVASGAALDRHMGDMIIPYLILAEGTSEVTISRVTQHTRTNAKVAEWLTGKKIDLEGELDRPGKLRVPGIGLSI